MRFRDILLQFDSYPASTPEEIIEGAVAFAKVLGGELAVLALQVDISLSRNVVAEALIKLGGLEREWEDSCLASCRQAAQRFESAAGVFAGAEIHRIKAARHLAAHGVEATVDEIDTSDLSIGRAIDTYLARTSADILVMGASGRAPVLEFVMGGATDHVLRNVPTALFLSHRAVRPSGAVAAW